MVRTSVLVTGVMGAVGASAHGTVTTGAFAYFTGPDGDVTSYDSDTGGSPNTYSASVSSSSPSPAASASASLVWGATSYSFSGDTSGNSVSEIYAYSNGVATFTFATAMYVTMSWNLAGVAGTSANALAGWSIEAGSPSATIYGIQFSANATTPESVAGGITAANIATNVRGQLAAGTYTVATAVLVDVPTSSSFSVTIVFTPVPAPGALPLVAIASIVARRGRRR
jgi:hypothetical protein